MSLLVTCIEKVDGLNPSVLNFIKGHVTEYDRPELETLASRLETSLVVDASLAMASSEYPQKSTKFRNEVLYLSYIIRHHLGEFEMDGDGEAFGNWVKSISGSHIENEAIHKKIQKTLGAIKANVDGMAFKLATGRMIARLSYLRIKTQYEKAVDGEIDLVPVRRLEAIVRKASNGCVFGKIGA